MLLPTKIPDINIVEDVWIIISDTVYDGPTFSNKEDLIITLKMSSVVSTVCVIQKPSLYESTTTRPCNILQKAGNLYNK